MTILFDYKNSFVDEVELENYKERVLEAHEKIVNKSGEGNEFLGWVDLPVDYDKNEFERIKKSAKEIQENSDALIVIGIGGSYLGARAVINSLTNNFYNELDNSVRKYPKIYYTGNNISSSYIVDLLEHVKDMDISLNVISKSGTTTESAIAFRIFKEFLEEKYGEEEANKRIYVTTDKENGALKKLADENGYESFVIPDDVGGRYSVFTPVGLLPIAACGVDIDELMAGAQEGRRDYLRPELIGNLCYEYAAVRNILYEKGKKIEILTSYTPELFYLKEWWKQLFGESEGKDGKGIFPASVGFTTDLHSMGQMIQDGERNIFESNILVSNMDKDIIMKEEDSNLDGLNYLSGKSLCEINRYAFQGTLEAHVDGGVPNMVIELENLDSFSIGKLLYYFQLSCGISAYLLGVNPFNQPGVEDYKSNMFRLLGKPGF